MEGVQRGIKSKNIGENPRVNGEIRDYVELISLRVIFRVIRVGIDKFDLDPILILIRPIPDHYVIQISSNIGSHFPSSTIPSGWFSALFCSNSRMNEFALRQKATLDAHAHGASGADARPPVAGTHVHAPGQGPLRADQRRDGIQRAARPSEEVDELCADPRSGIRVHVAGRHRGGEVKSGIV